MTCFNFAKSSCHAYPHRLIVPSDQTNHGADCRAQSLPADDVDCRPMGHGDNGMAHHHRILHQEMKEMINQHVQRLCSESWDALEELHQDFASLNRRALQYAQLTGVSPCAPKARKSP